MRVTNLHLDVLAARLEGFEETIISKLIDRAQYCVNSQVYKSGKSGFSGEDKNSLFEIRMHYQENMDALFGRFCAPEERPFTQNLPSPRRVAVVPESGLHIDDYNSVNLSKEILRHYFNLVGDICKPGDDSQYCYSVEHDVYALQAIARRIHFGAMYIAECKYTSAPDLFRKLIQDNNTERLYDILTRPEVEEKILNRIREKTIAAQRTINELVRFKIIPEFIVQFYRNTIIPLTKKGEVLYLMNRSKN